MAQVEIQSKRDGTKYALPSTDFITARGANFWLLYVETEQEYIRIRISADEARAIARKMEASLRTA